MTAIVPLPALRADEDVGCPGESHTNAVSRLERPPQDRRRRLTRLLAELAQHPVAVIVDPDGLIGRMRPRPADQLTNRAWNPVPETRRRLPDPTARRRRA